MNAFATALRVMRCTHRATFLSRARSFRAASRHLWKARYSAWCEIEARNRLESPTFASPHRLGADGAARRKRRRHSVARDPRDRAPHQRAMAPSLDGDRPPRAERGVLHSVRESGDAVSEHPALGLHARPFRLPPRERTAQRSPRHAVHVPLALEDILAPAARLLLLRAPSQRARLRTKRRTSWPTGFGRALPVLDER